MGKEGKRNWLSIGTLASLALFLSIFGADTLHLKEMWEKIESPVEVEYLCSATNCARACTTNDGGLSSRTNIKRRWQREIVCERTSTRSWCPFVDPYIYIKLWKRCWTGFQSIADGDQKLKGFFKKVLKDIIKRQNTAQKKVWTTELGLQCNFQLLLKVPAGSKGGSRCLNIFLQIM